MELYTRIDNLSGEAVASIVKNFFDVGYTLVIHKCDGKKCNVKFWYQDFDDCLKFAKTFA